MSYLCGVTLSSSQKGNIQNLGFYDIKNNISYKVVVSKTKYKPFLKSNIKVDVCKNNLLEDSFKNSYRFIFPISDAFWSKIKNITEIPSLNYKEITKKYQLDEWLI